MHFNRKVLQWEAEKKKCEPIFWVAQHTTNDDYNNNKTLAPDLYDDCKSVKIKVRTIFTGEIGEGKMLYKEIANNKTQASHYGNGCNCSNLAFLLVSVEFCVRCTNWDECVKKDCFFPMPFFFLFGGEKYRLCSIGIAFKSRKNASDWLEGRIY